MEALISFVDLLARVKELVADRRRAVAELRQLRSLTQDLLDVREGKERRLEGVYPTEVQPLVDDLNALLIDRELRVEKAAAKAGAPLAELIENIDIGGPTVLRAADKN